jgi:hypothetical protein
MTIKHSTPAEVYFKDVRNVMALDDTSLAFANLNKSTGDLRKPTFELGGFPGEVFLTTTVEVSDDNCHHKSLITVSKISSDL